MRFLLLPESAGCPTGLKRKWLDPITVEVSWMKPGGLSYNGDVCYEFALEKEVCQAFDGKPFLKACGNWSVM